MIFAGPSKLSIIMTILSKKYLICALFIPVLSLLTTVALAKKKSHPYDKYDHDMHTAFFESVSLSCETCHADPDSYGDRSKVNPLGCHTCHNSSNPPLPATNTCTLCHEGGPPKPSSHRAGWMQKHQNYAKKAPEECKACHSNQMFCINCHQKRETVEQTVHRRNFRFFHSIEARANPRKCDACHTVSYCQNCHAGKGTSKR